MMNPPLEMTGLTKVFPTPTGPFIAVKDVNAAVAAGEFVAILGHSGCGKSTVLSILAGLDRATYGGVVIDGREVTEPGPERAIVFQSPSLLPWLTSRQNVEVAATQGARRKTRREAADAAQHYLELVGVADAASQMPPQLSLGTQQCVSLARALSVEPRFLLLDEPFSMLDSLTRFELQDILLRVWEQSGKTVVMVTHDVDEALYLADRLILMTDGPEATVGDVLQVPFARPRNRVAVLAHPRVPRLPASHHRLPRTPRASVAAECVGRGVASAPLGWDGKDGLPVKDGLVSYLSVLSVLSVPSFPSFPFGASFMSVGCRYPSLVSRSTIGRASAARFSASNARALTASKRISRSLPWPKSTRSSAASRNCCACRAFPPRAATSAASSRPSAALRTASRSVPRARSGASSRSTSRARSAAAAS